MKTLTSVTLISLFALNIIFIGCGDKKEDTQSKKDEKSVTQNQTQQQTQQTQTSTEVPKIGKLWEQIEIKNEALNKVIQGKNAHHLDEPIGEVVSLVKTLPAKSAGLAQAKLDVIKSKTVELEKMGSNLDKLHHDKKQAEVLKEYENFNKTLNEIRNQYPSDSFQ